MLVATKPVDFRKGMDGLAAFVHGGAAKQFLDAGDGFTRMPMS